MGTGKLIAHKPIDVCAEYHQQAGNDRRCYLSQPWPQPETEIGYPPQNNLHFLGSSLIFVNGLKYSYGLALRLANQYLPELCMVAIVKSVLDTWR